MLFFYLVHQGGMGVNPILMEYVMVKSEAQGLAVDTALDANLTLRQLAKFLPHALEIWYASELGCYDAEGPTLPWPEDTAVANALEIFSGKLCNLEVPKDVTK